MVSHNLWPTAPYQLEGSRLPLLQIRRIINHINVHLQIYIEIHNNIEGEA